MRATIAMIAMSARISAYSARPWPSSSRRNDAIRAFSLDIMCAVHLPSEKLPETARGPGHSTVGVRPCQGNWTDSRCQRANWSKHSKDRRALGPAVLDSSTVRLDGIADVAQDRRDLAAEEDEGDDRDDGDEREDQRVLGQTLALLVPTNGGEELLNECHVAFS